MVDYLSQNLWLVWTLICVLALILEVSSGTFYIMCFAIGAVFAVVSSFLDIPFWVQVLVFVICSTVSVFAVRPFVMKYLHVKGNERVSNVDALIGRVGTVIQNISGHQSGYVKIDGDEWKAVSATGEEIAEGDKVRVISRESIIVTVEKA